MKNYEAEEIRIRINKLVYESIEARHRVSKACEELYELLEKDMDRKDGLKIYVEDWPILGSATTKLAEIGDTEITELNLRRFNKLIISSNRR